MVTPAPRAYAPVRQAIHWLVVALVLVMIPTGLWMARTLDDAWRLDLYRIHLAVGWVVVGLSIWRLVLRARHRVPTPAGLAPWNRALLHAVHWGVAAFPLLLAVSGMGAMLQNDLAPLLLAGVAPPATLDATVMRDGHRIGSYLFGALAAVHVAGIVRHQVRWGGALAPMRFGRR